MILFRWNITGGPFRSKQNISCPSDMLCFDGKWLPKSFREPAESSMILLVFNHLKTCFLFKINIHKFLKSKEKIMTIDINSVEKLKKYLVCLWVAAMIILVLIIGIKIVDADIILDQVR